MKDLTDYFTSPTKKTIISAQTATDLPLVIVIDAAASNSEEKSAKEPTVLTNIENSDKSKAKDVAHKKTRKSRKHKRKQSDPAVRNITELLSNSLSIISPNSSFTKAADPAKNGCSITSEKKSEDALNVKRRSRQMEGGEISSEKQVQREIREESIVLSSKKEVKNLNTSLLQDESSQGGKNHKNQTGESDEQQSTSKLNAFQFMMEKRNKSIGQNSPGKHFPEDDKTGDDNNYKQRLSARRDLLQNWCESKGASKRKRDEEERDAIISYKLKKRARRFKKLLQVDDHNYDDVILKKKRKRVKTISSSSDSSIDSVAIIENSKGILTGSVLDIIEENAQDQVLNESKLKETKQGLLNFFGVVNKTGKISENCNKIEEINEEKRIKIKMFTPKLEKKKSRLSLKEIEKESKDSRDSILEESTSEQPIIVEKAKTPKMKKIVDESSQGSILEKTKTPKTPKEKMLSESEDSLTPRVLRSWKMKIKINTDDIERTEKDKDNKNEEKRAVGTKRKKCIYKELLSDESSNEGSKLRDKLRTVRKQRKASQLDEIVLSSEDENFAENKTAKNKLHKSVKIAPVFTKATPKPKLDPEVLEAKKQFLMSGIPTSLKKAIEKQQSIEEKDYEIFPSISHIQQKCETQPFWNLAEPQLNLKEYSPLKTLDQDSCRGLTNSHLDNKLNIQTEVEKVDKLKTLLNKIKADNPNYPVYKSFRLIYEKSGKMLEKQEEKTTSPKRRRSKKRHKNPNKSIEIVEQNKLETDLMEYAMWTDKYKPKCSDDIIGNSQGVKNLKKWLEIWMTFSQEINMRKKKQRNDSTSESEFDTTDCDSRDSTRLPGNTVVLGGPCGSGKSVSVYAICNELGFNVIEINSSSKRTGKRLLQELQEATQSHQVRKGEQNNFFRVSKPKILESKEHQVNKKMCVLLIEDVDVVFEQDDGFISALTQLVSTSKRPIIMTTTDSSSVYVQKFVSQYEYISFSPLSSQSLATWLQIVCLVEGLFVNQGDIGILLEYNKGDVRKTLLHLQFWVQSGGQIIRDKVPVKIVNKCISAERVSDDEQLLCYVEDKNNDKKDTVYTHSNCISSFEIFRDHKQYYIPYYLNLGLIWWNIPNIVIMPNFSNKRRSKLSENKSDEQQIETNRFKEKRKQCAMEKTKLNLVAKLYDSLAFTDIAFRKISYFDGMEPTVKNYSNDIKDSLELGECMDCYNGYSDFVHEITHTLVNGYLEEHIAISKDEPMLNMAVPERAERRWRAKHHVCEDVFQEALSLSSYVERKSVTLDYMPSLRNISRLESVRAANNTKRGNRFRNYLRNLNINYNDNTIKLASNILTLDEF